MRKRWYRRILIMILVLTSTVGSGFSILKLQSEYRKTEVSTGSIGENYLIPGGMAVGIYMETNGVLVLGTDCIEGQDGMNYEPAEHLVKAGDYIIGINEQTIESKKELIAAVGNLTSESTILHIRRDGEEIDVKMKAVQTDTNEYKLGIWVRDNIQGLGTVTYLTQNNEFGALGHGIHDLDTGELLDIADGNLYATTIKGIQKGKSGSPGGIEGIIVYNTYNKLGSISDNTEAGIYGVMDKADSLVAKKDLIPICPKKEIDLGEATILCAVEGEVKEYGIEIIRLDFIHREVNKGIVIKVTDEKLLELTGGIVQGMSGSPILQNGRIVGAVTHVLVNDPARGYGIFIEDMLEH